ncbi:hypothetical protein ACTFIZ_001881 [Dictyostelium cf. discoideum]
MIFCFPHLKIPYYSCGVPSIFLKPSILSPDGKELNENEIGYYNSGDLGYKDKNGIYCILSRLDEQIIINDKKLSLNKIDFSILKHPMILESCTLIYNNQDNSSKSKSQPLPIALLVLKNNELFLKIKNLLIGK